MLYAKKTNIESFRIIFCFVSDESLNDQGEENTEDSQEPKEEL